MRKSSSLPGGSSSRDALLAAENYRTGLPVPKSVEATMRSGLEMILEHPGNLIRSQLARKVGLAAGLSAVIANKFALIVEYFHTASLLFDDLPCMDDATERRGLPCLHRTHGEETAILVSLGLINKSYILLMEAMTAVPPSIQLQLAQLAEKNLGFNGILNGQSQDLHGVFNTPQAVQRVAVGKTVPLLRLPLVMPAIAGGLPRRLICSLHRLAVYWGVLYQLLDDMKDAYLEGSNCGKTTGRDEVLGRPNLVKVEPANQLRAKIARLMRLSETEIQKLEAGGESWSFLNDVQEKLRKHSCDLLLVSLAQPPVLESTACYSI